MSGVIVEDRGMLDVGGGQLVVIEVPMDPDEPALYYRPAKELEVETDSSERLRPLEKAEVVEYLKRSGLIALLKENSRGGRNQPLAWLCRSALGRITHTFSPARGLLGGAMVPYWTLHENRKVFRDKVEDVVAFLSHFGLDREEALEVIRAVGTARGRAARRNPA